MNKLKIRDFPIVMWFLGLIFPGVGMILLFMLPGGNFSFLPLIFVVVGLPFLLFSSILTIFADRNSRVLTLKYSSLLRRNSREISFDDIASVDVQSSISNDDGSTSYTYRVAVFLKDGNVVPLRSYYSSGSRKKEERADQLRKFIGVQAGEMVAMNSGMAYAQTPPFAGGQITNAQESVTNGVHWKFYYTNMGNSTVTHWQSADFTLSGSFIYLTQKVDGQHAGAGILASLNNFLFKQSLTMYGYQSQDAPGMDDAIFLDPFDPSLAPCFAVFASDMETARSILTPWVIQPLQRWAEQHPLKTFSTGGMMGQLVVLFGPQGLSLSALGTPESSQLEELTNLGVDLVRTQVTPASGSASS